MEPSVRLEVWSDYVCPFCYLEEPVLLRLAEDYAQRVEIHWRAFELRPDPVPTLDPNGDYLKSIWAEAVYTMATARKMTLHLPPVQPRSRLAHESACFAREYGRFREMNEALFRAFFECGRDIGAIETLAEIADGTGLDPKSLTQALANGRYTDQVLAEHKMAQTVGISGVPALLVYRITDPAGAILLTGAQPYHQVHDLVERVLTPFS